MKQSVVAILAACAVLGGCGEQTTETPEITSRAEAPTVSADLASCPEPSETGKVKIFHGLDATILKNGYGRAVLLGDKVVVRAKLWIYDATAEGGKGDFVWEAGPEGFAFQLGDSGFIDGWSPGIACMRIGERRELIIASELAYGEKGRAPIPPNADIIYDLELMSVVEPDSES